VPQSATAPSQGEPGSSHYGYSNGQRSGEEQPSLYFYLLIKTILQDRSQPAS